MQFLPERGIEVPAAEPVARIVYASQAAIDGPIYSEMERIRASAVRNNEPSGVYTALLHQSGWFLQWKEGPEAAVRKIMERVAADARHHSLRTIHTSLGPRLLSGPWSMAIVQCNDSQHEMAQRVARLHEAAEAGAQFSPPAVWRRLSTPMRHPGAGRLGDPDAFQRVMVCASQGMASFDVTEWLARRTGEELVHRRFAGAWELDVGSDYVDFVDGEKVLRVTAMARKGLMLPLTRAFLPDYSHAVLLLSGDDGHDLALVERLAQACEELVAPPVVLGIAAHGTSHHRPFALARAHGLVYLDAVADPADPAACWSAMQPTLHQWRDAANSGLHAPRLARAGAQ